MKKTSKECLVCISAVLHAQDVAGVCLNITKQRGNMNTSVRSYMYIFVQAPLHAISVEHLTH